MKIGIAGIVGPARMQNEVVICKRAVPLSWAREYRMERAESSQVISLTKSTNLLLRLVLAIHLGKRPSESTSREPAISC